MSRKYCTSLSMLAVVFSLHATGFPADPSKSERHVVVVVWDGMRPDFVSEQNTPALWKLAYEGVTFRNHHAVYPSATMVNGTALVTGVYPSQNGIIANHVYRSDIDAHHAIDVELPAIVKKGDELSGGKYISAPTITELVQRAGGRTVIAAAKTVGLLLDRHAGLGNKLGNVNNAASPLGEGIYILDALELRGETEQWLTITSTIAGNSTTRSRAYHAQTPRSGQLEEPSYAT